MLRTFRTSGTYFVIELPLHIVLLPILKEGEAEGAVEREEEWSGSVALVLLAKVAFPST